MTTSFGKELLIQFIVRVCLERLSVYVCSSFPFRFEGWIWDFIVLIAILFTLQFCGYR